MLTTNKHVRRSQPDGMDIGDTTMKRMEAVYIPSALKPGTRFLAFTSEAIRRINLRRWQNTPFQVRKRENTPGTAEEIKAALAMAQGSSIAHRRAA